MIIDLDAHQGNGHERDHMFDKDIHIFDAYNHDIYPCDSFAKNAIKTDMEVHRYTSDDAYMHELNTKLSVAIGKFKPEFIIYNAGTDCLVGDPLGELGMTAEGIVKRDETIFEHCLEKHGQVIPVTMIMSGGYQMTNAEIIADSISNLVKRFHLSHESKIRA